MMLTKCSWGCCGNRLSYSNLCDQQQEVNIGKCFTSLTRLSKPQNRFMTSRKCGNQFVKKRVLSLELIVAANFIMTLKNKPPAF